jgi:hypothetical protein
MPQKIVVNGTAYDSPVQGHTEVRRSAVPRLIWWVVIASIGALVALS